MISYSKIGLQSSRHQKFRSDREEGKRGINIISLILAVAFLMVLAWIIK